MYGPVTITSVARPFVSDLIHVHAEMLLPTAEPSAVRLRHRHPTRCGTRHVDRLVGRVVDGAMLVAMSDLAAAMVLVFVAELGDKTQLVALGFGARYGLRLVVAGIAIAYLAAGTVSVVVGALIGAALPTRVVSLGGGLLFIGFAVWTALRPDADPEAAHESVLAEDGSRLRVVSSVAVAMFVAEFGDKTMLATATLASRGNPVAVFVGATVGIFLAGVLGAVAGRAVGRRLSERAVRLGSAALFGVFGVALIASAV